MVGSKWTLWPLSSIKHPFLPNFLIGRAGRGGLKKTHEKSKSVKFSKVFRSTSGQHSQILRSGEVPRSKMHLKFTRRRPAHYPLWHVLPSAARLFLPVHNLFKILPPSLPCGLCLDSLSDPNSILVRFPLIADCSPGDRAGYSGDTNWSARHSW